jgi:TIR domain
MRKIFLCYSRKDQRAFDAFIVHLTPFVANGQIQVWSDQEIRAAEAWEQKIHEAIQSADAAVLLVSPDFLASKFIVETEIPLLMEAAERGRLSLAPLFLRPTNVDARLFNVTNADNGEKRITITRYQGLNDPSQPIVLVGGSIRDDLLAAAARKLCEDLERAIPHERSRQFKQRELTVELRRKRDSIDRRYSRPRDEGFLNNRIEVKSSFLEAIPFNLEDERKSTELGARFFEILLGGDRDWPSVLRKALGEEVHSPVRHALRVRIVTDDALLRILPWAITSWRHYPLAEQGWTFEIAASSQPNPYIRLDTPCTAAMISAEPSGLPPLGSDAHHAGLEAIFGQAWNHPPRKPYLERARTVAAATTMLQSAPRLLYLYTHARLGGAGLELILEDENGRAISIDVADLLGLTSRPPQVLVLQTVGNCPPSPPIKGIPLLLHLRRESASFHARQELQVWWSSVLGGQWDPAKAFHELGAEARCSGTIITDYERWETTLSHHTPKTDRPRSRLDRRLQRQAIWDAVRDLVQSPQRRISCIVVYGSPGNLLDHFSNQSIDTLKEWDPNLARVHHYRLHLPESRDSLTSEAIEEKFRDLMQLQPAQELSEALQERYGGPQATPVHFFDWGTYGPGHMSALRTDQLEMWLSFCCENLRGACAGRRRILNYIAVLVSETRHTAVLNWIEQTRQEARFRQTHFDLVLVPALGKVTTTDLARFMETEDNSSCPQEYLHDLPQRIILKTGGDFEQTVKLLEEAERGMMWPELYETLPKLLQAPRRQKEFVLE